MAFFGSLTMALSGAYGSIFIDLCEAPQKTESQAEVFAQVFAAHQVKNCQEAAESVAAAKKVVLTGTKIVDLTPFQNFVAIEKLSLSTPSLGDLTVLASLPRLRSLHLNDTGPMAFKPLNELNNLQIVRLRYTDNTQLSENLNVLAAKNTLRALSLTGMRLDQAARAAIEKMTNLEELLIAMEPAMTSLDFVAPLKQLKRLHLGGTDVIDIAALASAKQLRELMIVSTPIRDISVLKDIGKSLKWLAVHHTLVRDFSPINHCANLTVLWLSAAHLSEIPDLSRLNKLTQLTLDDNDIISVAPLQKLTRLESLAIANNRITDIAALKDLDRLFYFNLKGNPLGTTVAKTAENCPLDGKSETIAEFCDSP